jgi:hypothetical protein
MITDTLTRRQVKEAIDTFFTATLLKEPVASEVTDKIVAGLREDLQPRDYLIGLADEYGLSNTMVVIGKMLSLLPEGNKRPLYVVLSALAYEAEDKVGANQYLQKAFDEDMNYPMAKLLFRVYMAEWSSEAMTTMRRELHPRVVENLDDSLIGDN